MRLYHDQALYKEAGGGPTPWHADQYYWPLTTDRVVTAWVPLQPVSPDMGPLAFAERTHTKVSILWCFLGLTHHGCPVLELGSKTSLHAVSLMICRFEVACQRKMNISCILTWEYAEMHTPLPLFRAHMDSSETVNGTRGALVWGVSATLVRPCYCVDAHAGRKSQKES